MSILPATDRAAWRTLLKRIVHADASALPEYHLAYALRTPGSVPLLWHYEKEGKLLLYPFLLTPVVIGGKPTGYHDISSIYGYTGAVASHDDPAFLKDAWHAFDAYAKEQRVVAEFVRFSPFMKNERFAHPLMTVEANRTLAASELPENEEALLAALGSKTRNMLRKAGREGLTARELPLPEYLPAFRVLYDETMRRNNAPGFFLYDDAYWNHMLLLGKDGLRLFGAFAGEKLVAASMAVVHGSNALYHLGASLSEYAKCGAGNLSLFAMSAALMHSGVKFINMTGGRTTAADDPLLLFKKSNATGTATFYIGKRIVDAAAYRDISALWQEHYGTAADAQKILFWR